MTAQELVEQSQPLRDQLRAEQTSQQQVLRDAKAIKRRVVQGGPATLTQYVCMCVYVCMYVCKYTRGSVSDKMAHLHAYLCSRPPVNARSIGKTVDDLESQYRETGDSLSNLLTATADGERRVRPIMTGFAARADHSCSAGEEQGRAGASTANAGASGAVDGPRCR